MTAPPSSEATRADLLLREALTILTPLVGALIDGGVTYSQFSQGLKRTFLDAARKELAAQDKRITDSALSLLSGVHRKDVRTMAHPEVGDHARQKAVSIASLVFARWSRDSAYLDGEGHPIPLPLRNRSTRQRDDGAGTEAPSFEQLTRSVSKDFHSRSVLDELLRLGLAELRGDLLHLKTDSFVPQQGYEDMLLSISANAHDFIAATMGNLRKVGSGEKSPFIERSIFEDRLGEASVEELRELAAQIWRRAAKQVYDLASQRTAIDAALNPEDRAKRVRFGLYFYAEDSGLPNMTGEAGTEVGVAGAVAGEPGEIR